MKRTMAFAGRNVRELLRDPLTIGFGAAFPILLLLLLTFISRNTPTELFNIESLTPGIAVFGLSFFSLFSGMLVAKDRSTSFLMRLFASPLTAGGFIAGYTLPLLPLSLLQAILCYAAALPLGLPFSASVFRAILAILPAAVLFIALGLFAGSLLNDKQVGGLCGALLTNVSVICSGAWFPIDLVGKGFRTFCYCLPFAHAVDLGRNALSGSTDGTGLHLLVVCGYALVLSVLAVLAFRRAAKRG
ncbi:MAG: ABC transporter permease [Clostridia bacterium]|nr:ABC transporter permease [Clostridia bacterium]